MDAHIPDSSQHATLDVMTLNTWGLPFPIAADRRARFPHIESYLRASGVELAGLEEVWRGAVGLLRLDGLVYGHEHGDSGLALVSRHAVDALRTHTYGEARGFDAWKAKGVLEARTNLPGVGPVWVFVTHLQSGASTADAVVRAGQATELLAEVRQVDGPAIVLGDFNLDSGDAVDQRTWTRLQAAGLVDAAQTVGDPAPTYLALHQRYDRIYLRDGGGVAMVPVAAEVVPYGAAEEPDRLSDHQPVRVKIRFDL